MRRRTVTKLLAGSLAIALLAQPIGAQGIVLAQDNVIQQEDVTEESGEGNALAENPPAQQNGEVGSGPEEIAGSEEIVETVDAPELISEEEAVETAPILQNGSAVIPANADETAVKEILGKALVSNADAVDLQSLQWEYYCTGKSSSTGIATNDAWGAITGFTSQTGNWIKVTYTHPALVANTDGDYKVRLTGTTTAVTLTKKAKLDSAIVLKSDCSTALVYNEDLSVNYDAVRESIFNHVIESTTPELTLADVTIEYYATATTGSLGQLGKSWVGLEGGTVSGLTYPAMSEGVQKIRVSYAGTDEYAAASAEVDLTVTDRPTAEFILKEAPYEVGMAFNDDQSYNYDATAVAIYDAVAESTVPELTSADVTVEYNAALTDLVDNYRPLNDTDWSNVKRFGPGTWEIRLSWGGNQEYKAYSTVVNVTVTDNRAASSIVCKSEPSVTYNMDANVMKQAILDNVIDWENSSLPAKDSVSLDDFTMEYYASGILAGNIDSGVKAWAPIEGKDITVAQYPIMGAGEQQVRISYKGSAEYRPSETTETTVTVAKAKVSVKVKTSSIYADQSIPEGFITTDPADKFDVYTIYAGMTSNVNAGVYLDMPARFTNSTVLAILDPVVNAIYGKTFTQMLNDGMTIGELRELLSTQEILDLLDKLNIDTGTFGQILQAINKMPTLADSVRVSFGTPNRAGMYIVTAVTDNPNYETGVGVGMLLVKMRMSGVQLSWNSNIEGGKLTAAEAAELDFGATLSYDGDVTITQDNVHYLYSGFTSKWRVYSSTTTPPTEPGRYVMTVVTLGGNYQAAPITRSFQITK